MNNLKFGLLLGFGLLIVISFFLAMIFIEEAIERMVYDFVIGLF